MSQDVPGVAWFAAAEPPMARGSGAIHAPGAVFAFLPAAAQPQISKYLPIL